jgi:hypothetical protein
MYNESKIAPLLNSLIKDNQTYKFPYEAISKEMLQMFLNRDEFEYFSIQAFKKLKREYGSTLAHIFLTTMDLKMHLQEIDIHTISLENYSDLVEDFISTLESLYITKIDKRSPDGELLKAMI